MMKKTRVLFVDRDISVCKLINDSSDPFGDIRIDTVYYEEDVVGLLGEIYYNIIIIDENMIGESDIELMLTNNPDPRRHPIEPDIILMSDKTECDRVVRIGKNKPMYLIKKPFDVMFLKKLIEQIAEIHNLKTKVLKLSDPYRDLSACVLATLMDIGVPASLNGYTYLSTGIKEAVCNPRLLEYITKDLYTEIAKTHHVSSAKVEKSIRDAITVAWDRGDTAVLREYFGNTISRKSGKPSNSVFFKAVINKIKTDYPNLCKVEKAH